MDTALGRGSIQGGGRKRGKMAIADKKIVPIMTACFGGAEGENC